MQIKHLNLSSARIKATNDDSRTFSGYASVFGGEPDAYGDVIVEGAFTETLKDRKRPVQLKWDHFGPVIGKFTEIKEDDTGLYVEGSLTPGHSVANDAYASLKHGSVSGLSIGYIPVIERQDEGIRYLHEIDLVEISVVETPAAINAQVANVKSAIDAAESLRDLERLLRSHGLSKSAATALVARVRSLQQPPQSAVAELAARLAR
ncbi:MAG TPA: HK97 family phage prohead protease [Salinisphaeraceae bacterium]|nr:HK97 family phage prohead protease [Salinisphaeraceae bacterium]